MNKVSARLEEISLYENMEGSGFVLAGFLVYSHIYLD